MQDFHLRIQRDFKVIKTAAKRIWILLERSNDGCRFQQRETTALQKLQRAIGVHLLPMFRVRRNCFMSKMQSKRLS